MRDEAIRSSKSTSPRTPFGTPDERTLLRPLRRPLRPEGGRAARELVPKVDEDDEEVPHAGRAARFAKGWTPKLRAATPSVLAQEARGDRARRIADALEELRRINASRLRN